MGGLTSGVGGLTREPGRSDPRAGPPEWAPRRRVGVHFEETQGVGFEETGEPGDAYTIGGDALHDLRRPAFTLRRRRPGL